MAVAEARDAYLSQFDEFQRGLAGTEPEWVQARRERAISRFAELGIPTQKHEAWKHTNLGALTRQTFRADPSAEPPRVPPDLLEPYTFGVLKCSQLVFADGRFAPKLSYLRWLPEGVRVRSLSEVLRFDPGSVEPRLGALSGPDDHPFTALNAAFMQDGAFIDVPAGRVVEEPIHLLFVSTSPPEPAASHPRNLVLLGDHSRATVIESYASVDHGRYLTNAVTEVHVADGAVLDHYKLERESDASFHIGRMDVRQGRGSSVSLNSLSFGGALVRNEAHTQFGGEGGELAMNGLYALAGGQHVDNFTSIDHAAPQCTSNELYKGILDGKSRGVFTGNIVVRPGAQKTVARQTNKNLMLSKDAHVDSIPGLEINANDVRCNHGSSIGRLDEDAVFYLQSRAIDPDTARSLLTYAFAAEIIHLVKVAPMRIKLDQLLLSRLPSGETIGESL